MESKANEFAELVESRNHRIIDGFYFNNSSQLTIFCLHHQTKNQVKAGLYKRAVFGVKCCASKKQSQAVSAANKKRALITKDVRFPPLT